MNTHTERKEDTSNANQAARKKVERNDFVSLFFVLFILISLEQLGVVYPLPVASC